MKILFGVMVLYVHSNALKNLLKKRPTLYQNPVSCIKVVFEWPKVKKIVGG